MLAKSVISAVFGLMVLIVGGVGRAEAAPRQAVQVVTNHSAFAYAAATANALQANKPSARVHIEASAHALADFCAGVGLNYPDIAFVSRRLDAAQRARCSANGVHPIEILLGVEGVQVFSGPLAPDIGASAQRLYLAIARDVPVSANGQMRPNPFFKWSDVDPALPQLPVLLAGPGAESALGALMRELILMQGARAFPVLRSLEETNPNVFLELVRELRNDRGYRAIETQESLSVFLKENPSAIVLTRLGPGGVLRLNAAQLAVEGKRPTASALWEGTYPLARRVRLYLKKEHLAVVPNLAAFMDEAMSEAALGEGGYLPPLGLVQAKAQ